MAHNRTVAASLFVLAATVVFGEERKWDIGQMRLGPG